TVQVWLDHLPDAGIRFREEPLNDEGMPVEFPAKLCLWLHHRFQHFGAGRARGCIVLPLELIEDNGAALRDAILQYAQHWGLSAAFQQWVVEENTFCDTLVDRIVSGYPTDRAAAITAATGQEDPLLVAGEYYHSWVISGPESVAHELPFAQTDLNVTFTNDLKAYREIKVRILNGAHTSIVPTGYLAGIDTVGEVMADETMASFLATVLYDEIIPSLDYPEEELKAFAADVLDRFRNPTIKHRLLDIALNSTSKFRTRLLPSLLSYQEKQGQLPQGIVRALAALIRFYRGDRNGQPIQLRDEPARIEFFQKQWAAYTAGSQTLEQLVRNLLDQQEWWGQDLNEVPDLPSQLTASLQTYLA
ncbi:MAG: tagaturonate reductase, partial [Bacteroidota bacterium]